MIERASFGITAEGAAVELFTLRNRHGLELRAMTYGGIIVSLSTPDREGAFGDIVLGFDTPEGYFSDPPYFGAIVGRYANRIAGGRFSLDGVSHQLSRNNGDNHLHGGVRGFDKQLWSAAEQRAPDGDGVRFTRTSADGEEGYPGAVRVGVTYRLTDGNDLRVDYTAEAERTTIINLSQHTYFNLSAGRSADILDHVVTLNADAFTPIDAGFIPTGAVLPVRGTPFDFTTGTRVGQRIDRPDEQLRRAGGYDHNWVLHRTGSGLAPAAHVLDPVSGRTVDVATTEPGVQFYSGNMLDGTISGKGGRTYPRRAGLCLETQHYPDSPNHPEFPSAVLRPGVLFRSTTVFRFGIDD